MKKDLNLQLHVWQEIISLLKYDYKHANNYKQKKHLTKQIIETSEKITLLQAEIREEQSRELTSLKGKSYGEKVS